METVNDIIGDMRYAARLYLQGGGEGRAQFEMLDSYADRLDAAYKRDHEHALDERAEPEREIARLKEALNADEPKRWGDPADREDEWQRSREARGTESEDGE